MYLDKIKLSLVSVSALTLLAACGGESTNDAGEGTNPEPATEQTQETEEVTTVETDDQDDQDDQASQEGNGGLESREFAVSFDQALDIFRDEVGQEDVQIKEVEFDEDDGQYVYEIEGYANGAEYDVEIDAETGDILESEMDDEDDFDGEDVIDIENIIQPNEAIQAAFEDANQEGYIDEWELEADDGQTLYEISFEDQDDRYVDAHTGEVFLDE